MGESLPMSTARRAAPALASRSATAARTALATLLDGQAGIDRVGGVDVGSAGVDVLVPLLDEEPRVLGLLRLHQRPAAAQLIAVEVEQELSLEETLYRVLQRRPCALVPQDHRPGPVLAGRDHPLEVAVLERVILDLHGEPLVGRVGGGALGHGPRDQRAAHLEPQVPVEVSRGVLLDAEEPSAGLHLAAHGLGSLPGSALGAVRLQPIGHGDDKPMQDVTFGHL
jgi:hypothetical protein